MKGYNNYKVGNKLVGIRDYNMTYDSSLFIKKDKIYVITFVDFNSIEITSEFCVGHGIRFSVVGDYLYRLKEYRRMKLDNINENR